MDGTTLLQQPLDPVDEVVRFMADLQSLRGFRGRVLKHSAGFARLYRRKLTKMQMIFATGSSLLLCAQRLSTSFHSFGWLKRQQPRTFISSTEPLDRLYTPAFRVESSFKSYFKPTMVTDHTGQLHEDLLDSGLMKTATVLKRAALV
jgi:hypothetical protein